MHDKKHSLSIRKLFPLLFSGMIAICIAVLLILFSRSVSSQIQSNVQQDTKRQIDSLSISLEREIQSMSTLINQVYYQVIKANDGTQSSMNVSLQNFYQQHDKQLHSMRQPAKRYGVQTKNIFVRQIFASSRGFNQQSKPLSRFHLEHQSLSVTASG